MALYAKFYFVLLLFVSSAPAGASTNCSTLLNSDTINLYEIYFKKLHNSKSSWGNFLISEKLFLLTDDISKDCLVAFHKGLSPTVNKLNKELKLDDWFMIDTQDNTTYPPLEKSLVDTVHSYNETMALALRVDKNIFYGMEIGLHEAFHHFYQEESRMPKWWKHVERENLVNTCYHSQVQEYKQEAQTLISGLDLLYQGHTEIGKKIIQTFINAREKRYLSLTGQYVDTYGEKITCVEAEAKMEFLEGHAQFFGEFNVIQLGLISKYSILSDYKYNLELPENGCMEPFYNFGSLQLHAIKILKSDDFELWSRGLYQSQRYQDTLLFNELKKLVEISGPNTLEDDL